MVDLRVLPGFIAMILLFLAPPGPDMAYMIAVGLERGRRSALKAILGIGTGMSIYAAAVVAGVGTAVRTHPADLEIVKVFGAAYLLWLAYATIRNARRTSDEHSDGAGEHSYMRGLAVSTTNPKIMLFFLAVLPQFLGGAQSVRSQLSMLGAVNVLTEVVLYGSIGVLAGTFNTRFSSRCKSGPVLNYFAGAVYLTLAAAILTELLWRGA